ncbi:MAG: radical SAM protein [Candidatus Omnitrophica bacterium]|nr:radical SAM protein [Candidatus Omnitrophota bacterium]
MTESSYIKSIFRHLAFLKYKPLVIPRVINGYFRKIILRQDVLRTVDLAITGDCHYKCVFCSAYQLYKRGGPFLSVEQIKDIWRQCVELGVIHVNLTGGEPLLRDFNEVCQIIRNLDPQHFLVSLVSNGLNITKDKLRELKKAGLDTLQLSIESTDAHKHDTMTGIEGNLTKVMEAIRQAKALNLNVCLNAVLYHGNIPEIKKLIDFSRQERVFLVLNTASSEGKWHGSFDKKLQLQDMAIFDEFMRFPHVRHDSSINFSGKRECPAGKERIHITAYGDVLTCPLVQISYGNVLKEPLKNIYRRMLNTEHLKKYSRMCKHAFDKEYYDKVISPIEKEEKRPVSIFNHPLFKEAK